MAAQQNGWIHSNNSRAIADVLFECVWPFVGLALKGLIEIWFIAVPHISIYMWEMDICLPNEISRIRTVGFQAKRLHEDYCTAFSSKSAELGAACVK